MRKTWGYKEWTIFVAAMLFATAILRPGISGFVDGLVAGFTDDR